MTAQIKAREEALLPLYTQIACEFADLHDRTGRMEAKGVIRGALEWRRSREFFHWRVRRRLLEETLCGRVRAADPALTLAAARAQLVQWLPDGDDRAIVAYLEEHDLAKELEDLRVAAIKRQISELQAQLP